MKKLNRRARIILTLLIIAAFFVPAYKTYSPFDFIYLAIDEANSEVDVTAMDVLVVLIPLLSIPFTALLILIRSLKKLPSRRTLRILPFLFFSFVLMIIFFLQHSQFSVETVLMFLNSMELGFFVLALTTFLLIFVKNREYLPAAVESENSFSLG